MFRTRISKIALGTLIVAGLTAGVAGVAGVATAATPSKQDLIATHTATAASASHNLATHTGDRTGNRNGNGNGDGTGEKVPFTANNVWTIARGSYDPTLTRNHSYVPAAGSYAADIKKAGGFAAEYQSPTTGNQITIAVAKGAPGAFSASEKKIAATSTAVDGFGSTVQVYNVNGGGTYTGDYEVFADGYWISVTSNLFTSTQAATPMIQSVLQTIPAG